MKQYNIWNSVKVCEYKGDKSWGGTNVCKVDVVVGTSSRNSHNFVDHQTRCISLKDGSQLFKFLVNNTLIKEVHVKNKVSKVLYDLTGSPRVLKERPLIK